MSDQREITEIDLHAFIDGELDADRFQVVEAAVKADAALGDRVGAYRADKAMLLNVYGPLTDYPVPTSLPMSARAATSVRRPTNWRLVGAIAASLLLLLSAGGVYWGSRPAGESDVVQAALDARNTALSPREFIAVGGAVDAARYNSVLSETLALNIKIPDLRGMHYQLASIRLYSDAAELSYQDAQNRLFTLYLRRSHGKAWFDQFARNGLRICVWQDDQVSMVMAGDVTVAAMQKLASLAYAGLTA